MCRSLVVLLALGLSLAACSTRTVPLEPGDWVRVGARGLRPVEGTVRDLTPESLVLNVETRDLAIPRSEITSLSRQERVAATPVGAIVGVLVGGVFSAAACGLHSCTAGDIAGLALVTAVVGAGGAWLASKIRFDSWRVLPVPSVRPSATSENATRLRTEILWRVPAG